MKKIAVIGAGYVGLVSGACFADKNNHVVIVENNHERINALLAGKVPFYEPGLDKLVKQGIANKSITFVDHISKALKEEPEVIFSCVGTPSQSDGSADLSFVWNVAKEIGQHISKYTLVVNKSTVPVGTAEKVKTIITQELTQRNTIVPFDVASNPEFLKEGDALNDFLEPDRIVVGTDSDKAKNIFKELYTPFIKDEKQLITMNIPSAELTKYASNAMLATRISFMNEMALLADKVGADIKQVQSGIAPDRRIGKYFLNAGIGYGGSCFPKDVKALIHTGQIQHQLMTLVKKVDDINNEMRKTFITNVLSHYNNSISGKTFALWGLAFKPETDDIRCAPSIDVINALLLGGAKIKAYDSVAASNIKKLFGDSIEFCSDKEQALDGADCLLILTEWKEFKEFPVEKFAKLKDKIVFDGRNCYEPPALGKAGITYKTIGRNSVIKSAKKTVEKSQEKYACATQM